MVSISGALRRIKEEALEALEPLSRDLKRGGSEKGIRDLKRG